MSPITKYKRTKINVFSEINTLNCTTWLLQTFKSWDVWAVRLNNVRTKAGGVRIEQKYLLPASATSNLHKCTHLSCTSKVYTSHLRNNSKDSAFIIQKSVIFCVKREKKLKWYSKLYTRSYIRTFSWAKITEMHKMTMQ